MKPITGITRILGVVTAISVAGCESLDVQNPNEPDTVRALSDPATIASVVGGTWSTWFNAVQGDASIVLTDMADSYSASWNNFNMRIYATEPRIGWINDPAATQRVTIEWFWYALYSMLSSANDGLIAIRQRGIDMGADGPMVETAALLAQGMALGWLALHYDQAFVVTDGTPRDPEGAPIVNLSPRLQVRDSALAKLDEAIALAQANKFSFPASWFGGGSFSYTNTQVAKIANSMAARILAYFPRTAAENNAVDWARVATYASGGISSGTPFDLKFRQVHGCVPPYTFCDLLKQWGEDPTTLRVHTRVARLLDPGTQDTPFQLSNPLTTLSAAVTASGSPQPATPASMANIRVGSSVILDPSRVASVTVTDGGAGCSTDPKKAPGVTIIGGHGAGAAATAVVSGGAVTSVVISNGGYGYTEVPTVRFSGGGCTSAAAGTAALNVNPNQEAVTVQAVDATTFTAVFTKDHATGVTVVRNGGSQGNPQPTSPDRRLGDGTYGSFALARSLAGVPADAGAGTDFMWSANAIFRPERGSWFQSNIAHIRYFYAGMSDPSGGGFGDVPQMLAAENDLLWAEGLIRSGGDLTTAANLINNTRVGRGGLPAATAGDADLLTKLQYEQDVELIGSGEVPYFNQRRIDNLEPLTPREFPIPAKELGVLKMELYTFGGPSDVPCGTCSAMVTGPRVRNVQQIWHEMLASRAAGRNLQ